MGRGGGAFHGRHCHPGPCSTHRDPPPDHSCSPLQEWTHRMRGSLSSTGEIRTRAHLHSNASTKCNLRMKSVVLGLYVSLPRCQIFLEVINNSSSGFLGLFLSKIFKHRLLFHSYKDPEYAPSQDRRVRPKTISSKYTGPESQD